MQCPFTRRYPPPPPPPPPDSAKEMPGLQMCWLHFTHVIPQIQEWVEN